MILIPIIPISQSSRLKSSPTLALQSHKLRLMAKNHLPHWSIYRNSKGTYKILKLPLYALIKQKRQVKCAWKTWSRFSCKMVFSENKGVQNQDPIYEIIIFGV